MSQRNARCYSVTGDQLAKKPISVELSRDQLYMLIREGAGSVQTANCARLPTR